MIGTIEEVKIVKGRTLDKNWAYDMQVVKTSLGTFIDNRPGGGKRGERFWIAPDYKKLIGDVVEFEVKNDGGYKTSLVARGRKWIKLKK